MIPPQSVLILFLLILIQMVHIPFVKGFFKGKTGADGIVELIIQSSKVKVPQLVLTGASCGSPQQWQLLIRSFARIPFNGLLTGKNIGKSVARIPLY